MIQINNPFESRSIYDIINTSKYPTYDIEGYINSPIIGRNSIWEPLGIKLSQNEKSVPNIISYDSFFTIRLDGHSFSKMCHKLKKIGVFTEGYSIDFEEMMVSTCKHLMKNIEGSIFGFTQSDEITIIANKCKLDFNGSVIEPQFKRRKDKLISIYSSTATSHFNKLLFQLFLKKEKLDIIMEISDMVFDARIGTYQDFKSAFELILWRSYDCSVNGISSAIHMNNNIPNKKSLNKSNSLDKLKFLHENGLLEETTNHQLYGTFFHYIMEKSEHINLKTGENIARLTKKIKSQSFPIIKLVKDLGLDFVLELKCSDKVERKDSVHSGNLGPYSKIDSSVINHISDDIISISSQTIDNINNKMDDFKENTTLQNDTVISLYT
uniref:tRNAHis guanylyltransferase catalytic domain-containing protein n=1 Tax=viral metagenome TaxID=1070528 RepID=A0A6C0BDM1_9ZZZZ